MLQKLPDNIKEENNTTLKELANLEGEKVQTQKDIEFENKTCLSDLYVSDFVATWLEDKKFFRVAVEVKHKSLDVIFYKTFETTSKALNTYGEHVIIGQTIMQVFQDILLYAEKSKASTTFHEEGITFQPHKKYHYQPEYDKEKKAWFILDKDNNRKY